MPNLAPFGGWSPLIVDNNNNLTGIINNQNRIIYIIQKNSLLYII